MNLRLALLLRILAWSLAGAVAGVVVGIATEDYESSATLGLASPSAEAASAARLVLDLNVKSAAEREPQASVEREPRIFSKGVSIPEYRRVRALIASPANFTAFARRSGVAESIQQRVRAYLATEKGLAELIAPVYSQTRGEIRDVGETKLDRGEPVVSALRVSFRADTPETAVAGARLLAAYVQDALLRDAVLTQLIAKSAVARSIKLSADAESVERRFAITQLEATVRDLNRVVQQYPASVRLEGRQVVSVEGGGDKYLSPIAQIVAAESRLIETRRDLDRLAQMARQAEVTLQFFGAAEPIANNPLLPSVAICDQLIDLARARLSAPDAKDDAAQARLLELLTWLSDLRSIYIDQTRLVAEPSMPERPQPPTRTQTGATGALLGLFLALAAAAIRQRSRRESPPTGRDLS